MLGPSGLKRYLSEEFIRGWVAGLAVVLGEGMTDDEYFVKTKLRRSTTRKYS